MVTIELLPLLYSDDYVNNTTAVISVTVKVSDVSALKRQ